MRMKLKKEQILNPPVRSISCFFENLENEKIDYNVFRLWFEEDCGISLKDFENAMLDKKTDLTEVFREISYHLGCLGEFDSKERETGIPQKWYFDHVCTIFGKSITNENSNIIEILDKKGLFEDEVRYIIKRLSSQSVLSQLNPAWSDEFYAILVYESWSIACECDYYDYIIR